MLALLYPGRAPAADRRRSRPAVPPGQLAARTWAVGRALPRLGRNRFLGRVEQAVHLPVFNENDGNAAAIAELFYGCGRQCRRLRLSLPRLGDRRRHRDRWRLPARRHGQRGRHRHHAGAAKPPASAPLPAGQWDILLSRASLNALARHLRYSGESIQNRFDLEAPASSAICLQWTSGSTIASTRSPRRCAQRCACSTCRPSCSTPISTPACSIR